jgi:predicted phosphodiesterase
MKFVVINDIHANYYALKEVSKTLSILKFDKLIILGDTLTYGVLVQDTIDILKQFEREYNCIFIKGNHDQIYFDIQNGKEYQYKPFPFFINESVLYTADKLNSSFESMFDWQESFVCNDVLFTHANMYTYGNWSYLNTEDEFLNNYNELEKRNLRGAVFGHTHRAKYQIYQNGETQTDLLALTEKIEITSSFLLTNGSLGQPRSSDASFLICDINDDTCTFESKIINYDVEAHCRSLSESSLSLETQTKLLSFYK